MEDIYSEAETILEEERDKKLETLKGFIEYKVKEQPYNKRNKKILIFTAFADTANYLYDNLSKGFRKQGLVLGLIRVLENPK